MSGLCYRIIDLMMTDMVALEWALDAGGKDIADLVQSPLLALCQEIYESKSGSVLYAVIQEVTRDGTELDTLKEHARKQFSQLDACKKVDYVLEILKD